MLRRGDQKADEKKVNWGITLRRGRRQRQVRKQSIGPSMHFCTELYHSSSRCALGCPPNCPDQPVHQLTSFDCVLRKTASLYMPAWLLDHVSLSGADFRVSLRKMRLIALLTAWIGDGKVSSLVENEAQLHYSFVKGYSMLLVLLHSVSSWSSAANVNKLMCPKALLMVGCETKTLASRASVCSVWAS